MNENDKEVVNVVVKKYPIAGLLYVNNANHASMYYLLSPTPITTWNYGQVVALVFECVPLAPTEMQLDGISVFPYKRNVVVGIGASWHVEYDVDFEEILVEDYEDVN